MFKPQYLLKSLFPRRNIVFRNTLVKRFKMFILCSYLVKLHWTNIGKIIASNMH